MDTDQRINELDTTLERVRERSRELAASAPKLAETIKFLNAALIDAKTDRLLHPGKAADDAVADIQRKQDEAVSAEAENESERDIVSNAIQQVEEEINTIREDVLKQHQAKAKQVAQTELPRLRQQLLDTWGEFCTLMQVEYGQLARPSPETAIQGLMVSSGAEETFYADARKRTAEKHDIVITGGTL